MINTKRLRLFWRAAFWCASARFYHDNAKWWKDWRAARRYAKKHFEHAKDFLNRAMSPNPRPPSRSICQHCVWETHPTMLTTYSVRSCRCARCGRTADLALTVWE